MKIVWFHYNLVVESHMVENPDKTIVETGHRGFTRVRSNLQEFFFNNIEFLCHVCALVDATVSTSPQRAVTVKLATSVYWEYFK